MQIHELDTFIGTTSDSTYLAIDDGTETNKIPVTELGTTIMLEIPSFSSLPQTITDDRINTHHIVLNSVFGNPSAQTSDWTVTTSDGSLTISGSMSGSTTLTLYLNMTR